MKALKNKAFWFSLIFAALILIGFLYKIASSDGLWRILMGPRNALSLIQVKQFRSDQQLGFILQSINSYRKRHQGRLPETILNLASDDPEDLSIYYAPIMPDSERPPGWRTNKPMLAANIGYCLSRNPGSGVLVFEKRGIWPDGSRAVGFSDGRIQRMSETEFESLIVQP